MASRCALLKLWGRFVTDRRIYPNIQRNYLDICHHLIRGLDNVEQGLKFAPKLAINNGLHLPEESFPSVLGNLKPWLMAVQRNRRSVERRRERRFAENRIQTLKKNIVVCLNCGEHHEKDTICGNCYSKVRRETEAMREATGEEEYYYNQPRSEVSFVYQDDSKDLQKLQGKHLVEIKKIRPGWFPANLKTKV